ncbi:MAG: NADH-quinone oxidoreductase subunit K [Thermoproteota archaeon]|nr:MAG: NADH-quinone oxidoreductase subunit K [Candidatus Korarchaeota archaeon]RLG48138.1 MAG: NADH-quinone oxidoreductase subunit K [Candidatus Korarchaeota archaeon]
MLGESLLLTSGLLVALGVYGLLSTRSLIRMLLSVEVMFNGALLALLTLAGGAEGAALALVAVSLAAAEVGVVVSLAVLLFRRRGVLDVAALSESKG